MPVTYLCKSRLSPHPRWQKHMKRDHACAQNQLKQARAQQTMRTCMSVATTIQSCPNAMCLIEVFSSVQT